MLQNEITSPLSVLNENGLPQNFGWSRAPVFFYDYALIMAPKHRISESDRYIIHSPTHLIVFEIKDDGWLGYMSVSLISLRDKKCFSQIHKTFLPRGSYELPGSSDIGSVYWKKKNIHLDFCCLEGGGRIIKFNIPEFDHNRCLRGALILNEPPFSHSLATNQPWRNEKYAFKYTRCSPCFSVEGVVQFGSTEIVFTKGNGWGIFEWNRGSRPREDIRYWTAGCGMRDGRQLSFCAGYSWADFSHGTENGFFVDGKLHKLDQVTFHIPPTDWLAPWRFTSNDNRLEMVFNPHQVRFEKQRMLLHNYSRRQVCGFFTGKVQLDDGSTIKFKGLTGFAERCKMRF